MSLRVGVDTGGTFTDVCLYDDVTSSLNVLKVPSTPHDPGEAIIRAIDEIVAGAGRHVDDLTYFGHGTTVGTNALLTEGGVRTGLLTTQGFRDLLELARGRRPSLYDLQADKPRPLVPRDLRIEVKERLRYTGEVETPLQDEEVRAAARQLSEAHVDSVAVCFLYSYVRPDHERAAARILREELPDAYISISSDVLPEMREYERLSTVVGNAYIGPIVANYLRRLRNAFEERGLRTTPYVTQSNGGVVTFESAEPYPIRMVLSGPSTGVVAAAEIAMAAGYPDIVSFDMGGTSTDVSLVQKGVAGVASGLELDGRVIRAPMLDIHTVGAGGGSIAWLDNGGLLKVGPKSAGADPGPACYGKGTEPTVTDANVVIGALNPDYFLGGAMTIDAAASRAAVGQLATAMGMDVAQAAHGIIRVVVANMARAIRVVSVQRGYDPRSYALLPFGGAGPLHASWLAAELGMKKIIVPERPGALSALGLLITDLRTDFAQTRLMVVDESSAPAMSVVFEELAESAGSWFDTGDVSPDRRELVRSIDMRYVGQNYEIAVPVPAGAMDAESVQAILRSFAREHERLYGYSFPTEPVQAVTFRLQAIGRVRKAERAAQGPRPSGSADPRKGTRQVYLPEAGGFTACPIFDRFSLSPEARIQGPAVIEQMDSTTLLLPGDVACVDQVGNLVIDVATHDA
jgi:N-methylhydantoinase A